MTGGPPVGKQQDYDQMWEKELRALGLAITEVQEHSTGGHREGPEIKEIRILLDRDSGTSVLCILKAAVGDEKIVGFVGGRRLSDTVLALADKLRAGAVKWREDRPWNPV
jgi:hypothetical protein